MSVGTIAAHDMKQETASNKKNETSPGQTAVCPGDGMLSKLLFQRCDLLCVCADDGFQEIDLFLQLFGFVL